MQLESLPAKKGDCFILTWQGKDKENYIIIDGGSASTYSAIKDIAIKRKNPLGVVITHIDTDHFRGIEKFFKDEKIKSKEAIRVYVNTPEFLLCKPESDNVSAEHGPSFEKVLSDNGITPISLFLGMGNNDTLELDGLTLEILSPREDVLKALITEWEKYDEEGRLLKNEELKKASEESDNVSLVNIKITPYDEIIATEEDVHPWKDDLENASSIAFIASSGEQKILFLGDANPELLYEELSKKYSRDNKLKVNLVKLSHHGCKHNTTKNLLSIIDCTCFLLSTNGTGAYYHPHRETLVRVAEYSRKNKAEPICFFTNYNLNKELFITEEEEMDWNISINRCNVFDLNKLECSQKD